MEKKPELHIEKLVNMYAVADKVAEIFMPAFSCENHAKAIQGFADAANDPRGVIIKHPSEYDLYFLGTYNQRTGMTHNNIQFLANAKELLKVQVNDEQNNKALN
jgi:hypothetical protein